MAQMLALAKDIATPLSLAALSLLILHGLFKTVFAGLKLERVIGKDVFRLLQRAMLYVFIVALVGLVLGVSAFIIPTIVERIVVQPDLERHIAQLNETSTVERISGISGLEAIALKHSGLTARICDAFAAFVKTKTGDGALKSASHLPDDVQRAMVAISNLLSRNHCLGIDLSGSDLRRIQLPGGNLHTAKLTGVNLEEANFFKADLSGARLIGARFMNAVLREALLKDAALNQIEWRDADLRAADASRASGLQGADLSSIQADGMVLDEVDLRGARFPQQMSKVSLKGADLDRTDLTRVRGLCSGSVAEARQKPTQPPIKYDC